MSLSERPVRDRTVGAWGRAVLDEPAGFERELWVVVVVTLFANGWLTRLGLQHRFREGNPAVRRLVEPFGIAAPAAVTLAVLGVGGLAREPVPDRHTPVVPAGLALSWPPLSSTGRYSWFSERSSARSTSAVRSNVQTSVSAWL